MSRTAKSKNVVLTAKLSYRGQVNRLIIMESLKSESSKSSGSEEVPSTSSSGSQEHGAGGGSVGMPEKYADVRCMQLYNEW